MTYQPRTFTVEDALARNAEVYEVEFADWGFRTGVPPAPGAAANFQYPPLGSQAIPSSLAAVSIGPRSTVSRCWLSWNRQKPADASIVLPERRVSSPRIASVEAPLLFKSLARRGRNTQASALDAMADGLLYAFPFGSVNSNASTGLVFGDTTAVPADYLDQFGVVRDFEESLGPIVLAGTERPFLHLLLHAKPPPLFPATRRAPMVRGVAETITTTAAPVRVCALPIYGRRSLRIGAVSYARGATPGRVMDYYVGLVRNVNEGTVATGTSPSFEISVGSALAVPVGSAREFVISAPNADYLMFYARPAGGVGNTSVVAWSMIAED